VEVREVHDDVALTQPLDQAFHHLDARHVESCYNSGLKITARTGGDAISNASLIASRFDEALA